MLGSFMDTSQDVHPQLSFFSSAVARRDGVTGFTNLRPMNFKTCIHACSHQHTQCVFRRSRT